jgi:hypothetical protein
MIPNPHAFFEKLNGPAKHWLTGAKRGALDLTPLEDGVYREKTANSMISDIFTKEGGEGEGVGDAISPDCAGRN